MYAFGQDYNLEPLCIKDLRLSTRYSNDRKKVVESSEPPFSPLPNPILGSGLGNCGQKELEGRPPHQHWGPKFNKSRLTHS